MRTVDVRLIACLPGVNPAVVNEALTGLIDLFPNVCRPARVALPDDRVINGRDLMPLPKDANEKDLRDALHGVFLLRR